MQRQNQAVNLEGNLVFVGILTQLARLPRLHHGSGHGGQPGAYRVSQGVTHRARPVVKFDRAADVDAARINFDRSAVHPVMKHGLQARQATRLRQHRKENLFFKAGVVFTHHGNLQFFTRTKVGKNARLAHMHDLGQRANAQALQANLRRQAERRINNGRLGLLAFLRAFRRSSALR